MENKNTEMAVYVVLFFSVFLIDLLLSSFLSFLLTPEEYSFYIKVINLIPLATVVIGVGTPFSILYLSSLSKKKGILILNQANVIVLANGVFFVVLFSIGLYFRESLFFIFAAVVLAVFNVLKQNAMNYLLGGGDKIGSSFVRLNQKLFHSIVLLAGILIFGIGSSFDSGSIGIGLFLLMLLGEVIGFIVLQYKLKVVAVIKLTKIKSIFLISKGSLGSNLANMVSLSAPLLVLDFSGYNNELLASFGVAFLLIKSSGIILGPFFQLITPFVAPVKSDKRRVFYLYRKFSAVVFFIGLGAAVFFHVSSDFLISILYSSSYFFAAKCLQIMSISIPFLMLVSFSGSFLSSIGGVFNTFKASLLSMFFMVSGAVFSSQYDLEFFSYFIVVYYLVSYLFYQFFMFVYLKSSLGDV